MNLKNIPKKKLYLAISGILVLVVVIVAVIFISNFVKQKNAEKLFSAMQGAVVLLDKDSQEKVTAKELNLPEAFNYDIPNLSIDFKKLQSDVSPDIYAWIYVPDTKINYPIVQNANDDAYYLKYNLDGSKGLPGGIYTEKQNSKGFDDPLTVIYGHNMRNDTMFGDLHKFEDQNFFNETRYFFIYTPDGVLVYEIFAANTYDNSHLLTGVNSKEPAALQAYLNYTFTLDGSGTHIYDADKRLLSLDEINPACKIVTLSTCTGDEGTRYLVQGVLLNNTDPKSE